MAGWIKLHRSIDDWEWRAKPNTLSVWLYLLTHARHEAGSWQGISLEAGQLITGTEAIGKVTGLSRQSVRTALEHLKKTGEITIKATNRFSVVTVVKWGVYQSSEVDTNQQTNQRTTNNQPATNQQLTTNKNEKNERSSSTPHPPRGGSATTIYSLIEELVEYASGVSRIVSDENDPTIRKYFWRFIGWGATQEEIKFAIDIVRYNKYGGRTSLERLVWAIHSKDTSRIKDWEMAGWQALAQQRRY